jgi:hypothetical protein
MGARQSSYDPPEYQPSISIKYKTIGPDGSFVEKIIALHTAVFPDQAKWAAGILRREAVDGNVSVVISVGDNYTPSFNFKDIMMREGFGNVFSGIYITHLQVDGSFDKYHEQRDKLMWWQRFFEVFKHVGVTFRDNSTVTIPALGVNIARRDGAAPDITSGLPYQTPL